MVNYVFLSPFYEVIWNICFTDTSGAVSYHWTRRNDMIMWSDRDSIAMGGGGKGFAFVLTDDFYNGNTNRSDTFDNTPFVAGNQFKIDNVEVWGFPKYYEDPSKPSRTRR